MPTIVTLISKHSDFIKQRILQMREELAVSYLLFYFPWCATKLPKNLTHEWFATLEKEYSLDNFDSKKKLLIPKEFKTDEWWQKRGL